MDMKRRSQEPWERGRGAPRKGNPRYKPVMRGGKKVYIVRDSSSSTKTGMMDKGKRYLGKYKWRDRTLVL